MLKISNLLKKLDHLGPNFKITFQGEECKKSFVGAFITFVILIIFVIGLCLIGQEIIYKEKPYVTISEYFSKEGTIDFAKMVPIVIYTDSFGRTFPLDSKFFDAIETSFELYEIIFKDNVYRTTFFRASTRLCTLEDFQKNPDNEEKCNNGVCITAFCLDENKITDMTGKPAKKEFYLNNEFGQVNSSFVQIKTQLCNEKLKPGCRAGLNGVRTFNAIYLYLQNSLNVTEFGTPIKTYQKGLSAQLSLDIFRRDFIHLQMGALETDEGFILSNVTSENYYNTISESNFTLLYSEITRNLYGVNFDITSNKLIVKRQYMKVQELIASIGGFIKALMLAGSILLGDYSDAVFYNNFVAINNFRKLERKTNPVVRFNHPDQAVNVNSSNSSLAISRKALVEVSFWQYLLHKFGRNSVYVDIKAVNNLFDIHHLVARIKKLEMQFETEPLIESNQNQIQE